LPLSQKNIKPLPILILAFAVIVTVSSHCGGEQLFDSRICIGTNNFMNLNEADTRAKLIDPAIHKRGWSEDFIKREETAGAVEIINLKVG